MERFIKGDIVVVPFPFSNLTNSPRRPALVLATLDGDDVILCQITTQYKKDRYAIAIEELDFETGSLKQNSNVRPNRVFTADYHIIKYKVGNLKSEKMEEIIKKLIEILTE